MFIDHDGYVALVSSSMAGGTYSEENYYTVSEVTDTSLTFNDLESVKEDDGTVSEFGNYYSFVKTDDGWKLNDCGRYKG